MEQVLCHHNQSIPDYGLKQISCASDTFTGSSEAYIILSMIVRGLGISFLIAPVSTAMLNAVKPEQTPTATSLNTLMLQLGGSVGIAASSALHTHLLNYYNGKGYTKLLAEHYSLRDGFLV